MRNWRVTARLVALIALPTLMALLLAGGRVSAAVSDANDYRRVQDLAEVAAQANVVAHALEIERAYGASYAATDIDPRKRSARERTVLKQAETETDAAVTRLSSTAARVSSGASKTSKVRIRDLQHWLDTIPAIRDVATNSWMSAQGGIEKYSEVVSGLLEINDDVADSIADPGLAATARAEAALARAKDQATKDGSLIYVALYAGHFEPSGLESAQAARANRESQTESFLQAATLSERQMFEDTVSGPEIDLAETMRQRLIGAATGSPNLSVRPVGAQDAANWAKYGTALITKMRSVEQRLTDTIGNRIGDLKSASERSASVDGALLFIVLLLVLAFTLLVARSLVQPLRKLRVGALDVANNRLPGLVERLRDSTSATAAPEVEPIDVKTADEIGEVARAFDEVHKEAARLASEEASLRGNINAMFVNLARRMQSLIERQLRLIDDLEQSEQDDDQLASLFRLDHLATRMRRNAENLLVLGGQEQIRRWNQPVPLIDVIRASLSEVEQYERVGLRVQGDLSVVGPVVNDLIHLVAELIENATVFSPEHTKVTLSGHLVSGGGAMLQITDNGVGMTAEELEAANWRLANPPMVDVSAARRMGLFVVGRLATRHGIRVELRAALSGGLTAFVLLPPALIAGAESAAGSGPRALDQSPQASALTAGRPTGPTPVAALESGPQAPWQGAPPVPPPPPAPPAPTAPAVPAVSSWGDGGARDDRRGPWDERRGPWEDPGGRPQWDEPGAQRPWDEPRPQTRPQPQPQASWGDTEAQPSWADAEPRPSWAESGAHATWEESRRRPGWDDAGAQQSWEERPIRRSWEEPAGRPPWDEPARTGRHESAAPAAWDEGPRTGGAPGQGGPGTGPQYGVPGDARPVPEEPPARPARRERGVLAAPHDAPYPDEGDVRHTGPQPVPPSRWDIPTGPHPMVSGDESAAPGGSPRAGSASGTGAQGGGRRPLPVRQPRSSRQDREARPPAPPVWDDGATDGQGFSWGAAENAPKPAPANRPERSPIFDAMESEWFQRRTRPADQADAVPAWRSAADEGWHRAEAVQQATVTTTQTSSGLPKRVPGKNRIPGSVAAAAQPAAPVAQKPKDADQIRSRFASLQQGAHRGRLQSSRPDDETEGGGKA